MPSVYNYRKKHFFACIDAISLPTICAIVNKYKKFLTENDLLFSRLDDHLIIKHNYRKDEYRCDLCPKAYSHRPCLIKHRAVIHGEHRKYHCENCPKVNLIR